MTGKPVMGRKVIAKPHVRPPHVTRKQKFEQLNLAVTQLGGWITSIPGDPTIVFECLPGSTLPDDLRDKGDTVVPADPPTTERIIAGSVIERLELSSSGAFMPATEGSTRPVYLRSHSGIVRVERFQFNIG